jgi:hypothetical protein
LLLHDMPFILAMSIEKRNPHRFMETERYGYVQHESFDKPTSQPRHSETGGALSSTFLIL